MTMNVNKKLVARLMAVVLATTTWGAMAATSDITMTGKVTDATCTLNSESQNVAVDLGTASTQDFTGQLPGYAATTAAFNLVLEGCGDTNTLKVWASGATPEPGLTHAIKNTHTGGATGVALQVFRTHGGATTLMNPNSDAASGYTYDITGNTSPSLPFVAKMVKVAATNPTAGDVKGTVTINVAYP